MPFLASSTLIILCGKTGSGKTLLLQQLESAGFPVINLETLASHRGSAFGGLLLSAQPSQDEFELALEKSILKYDSCQYIFIEQKPPSLGKRKIPGWLYSKMNEGIAVKLNVDKKTRINTILKEYKPAGKESFINALHKLKQRLHLTVIKELEAFLHSENYEAFIEGVLDYYDNTSKYNLDKKADMTINVSSFNNVTTIQHLLESLRRLNIIIS